MTLERCPVCRARLHAASECPRCGASLEGVLRVAARADAAERAAIAHLVAGHEGAAAHAAREACRLRRTPLSTALATFAASRSRRVEPSDPPP